MFRNNWIEIPNKDENIIVNEYSGYTPYSLMEALQRQAALILEDYDNVVVMVSGGVDSQQAALGFSPFFTPRYVFIRLWINGKYNKAEYLFANEFAEKFGIDLEVFDVEIDITKFLPKYITTESGLGALIQLHSYEKFLEKNRNSNIVVSTPLMSFKRNGKICSGQIPSPYRGLAQGYDPEKFILFYYYAPAVFRYYESVHRKNKTIQYFAEFQPKNLAFTELGFPLRTKLNGWESSLVNDISQMTLLDFGNDHGIYKYSMGKVFRSDLNINQEFFDRLRPTKPNPMHFTELYRFETDIDI